MIINLNEPPSLLRNDVTSRNHWLKLKLVGTKSNRSAIGARVLVSHQGKKSVQSLTSQSSYLSSNDPRLHFGLGASRVADVEIHWPSGTTEHLRNVVADRLVTVKEGAGIVASTRLHAA